MRWVTLRKLQASIGTKETYTKFLWFPKTLNQETRWLENCLINREYRKVRRPRPMGSNGVALYAHRWVDLSWGN